MRRGASTLPSVCPRHINFFLPLRVPPCQQARHEADFCRAPRRAVSMTHPSAPGLRQRTRWVTKGPVVGGLLVFETPFRSTCEGPFPPTNPRGGTVGREADPVFRSYQDTWTPERRTERSFLGRSPLSRSLLGGVHRYTFDPKRQDGVTPSRQCARRSHVPLGATFGWGGARSLVPRLWSVYDRRPWTDPKAPIDGPSVWSDETGRRPHS